MLTHGTPLYSQVPLPHEMKWLKVSTQNIFLGRKRLPSSLFTTPSKSPPKDSLISSDGSEMLLLIVMLVEIYTDNMSHEYQAHLENLDIIQFA